MLDSLSLDHSLPERQSGVVLQTIHSAKGQEADELVLAGWDEGLLPFWKAVDDREQLDEERRLAFVALTRSKGKVVITTAEDRGGPAPSRPSRFLSDIQHLVEDESCR
jgi:DNA helicase-2/ATP-dependent DNA helicase PcrA